jgi:hypothetical protein
LADGKVNYDLLKGRIRVKTMADFKKRNAERKGGKKEEIKRKKLIEENLDDLRGRGEEEP